MAKAIKDLAIRVSSSDDGATKTVKCTYTVHDDADTTMRKRGEYVDPSPDFTKTIDTFYADCLAGAKAQEGIA